MTGSILCELAERYKIEAAEGPGNNEAALTIADELADAILEFFG